MAFWQARDFLFCSVCGTLLSFDSVRSASCLLCGFKRQAKELEGKETRYTVTAEDIRRELKLESFVVDKSAPEESLVVKKNSTINEPCLKCDSLVLEFWTQQLRSADEGQTVFYKCPACGDTSKTNT